MKGTENAACSITYGQTVLDYELVLTNRKSMEIAVHPDKRIVVKAPVGISLAAIEARVVKRAGWIKKQLAYFSQFDPRTPARRYVGGESHLYLGRKYRLKLELAESEQVRLKGGYFFIHCHNREPAHIKTLLEAWYRNKADVYLPSVFETCWGDFNKGHYPQPTLKLKEMKTRWGSLSSKGQMTLNLQLIQAPRECIEYVVMHELCHLAHHGHGPEFYELLDRVMPDWAKRKHKLEATLA